MSAKLDINPDHAAIVRDILHRTAPAGSRVFVFGSRATGRARRTSDLDLAVDCGRPLSHREEAIMEEEFDEAPVPWSVDIVDLQTITPRFRSLIERDLVPFAVIKATASA